MAYRFWRRMKIAPGVTLNLSKSGGSISFGPRGAKITIGSRGRRATVGIPGTGLFYTTRLPDGESEDSGTASSSPPAVPTVRPQDRLTLGFFKRLVTPDDEKALVDGCRELVLGDEDEAIRHLERAAHLADGAYLAGFMALKRERLEEAADYLTAAVDMHDSLGRYFTKYGVSPIMSMSITDEVSAHVGPDLRGVLLGLVEVYQRMKRRQDAIRCLERLERLEPDDVVVKLSLAEVLLTACTGDWTNRRDSKYGSAGGRPFGLSGGRSVEPAGGGPEGRERDQEAASDDVFKKIVRLASGLENDTPVHTALLLYKARALRGLGLLDAARETLTKALRRKRGRSEELLRALRYERAVVYEELGWRKRARKEFEKLYAEDPDYEDVAVRLGL